MSVNALELFPGPLTEIYEALRTRLLHLGDDVVEHFTKSQVSFGAARKFVWLIPLTKAKALLVIDMWEEHHSPLLRDVIPYRQDKFTHQLEVRTPADIDAVAALGWFAEAVAWGRKQH